MTRAPARDEVRMLGVAFGVPKGWFSFSVVDPPEGLAAELGREHADTPEARAFLTRSLTVLVRDAVKSCVGELLCYVPDRQVGEVVAFAQGSVLLLPRPQDATAQAYAARSPRQIGGRKFKVLDHWADVIRCPAGPASFVVTWQRQRYTASTFWELEIVIFPEYEGLRRGVRVVAYSSHPDLGERLGRWCRTIAEHVEADVGYADGTVLATFGADPVETDGSPT